MKIMMEEYSRERRGQWYLGNQIRKQAVNEMNWLGNVCFWV